MLLPLAVVPFLAAFGIQTLVLPWGAQAPVVMHRRQLFAFQRNRRQGLDRWTLWNASLKKPDRPLAGLCLPLQPVRCHGSQPQRCQLGPRNQEGVSSLLGSLRGVAINASYAKRSELLGIAKGAGDIFTGLVARGQLRQVAPKVTCVRDAWTS